MLVDLALIGINGTRFDLGDRHRAPGALRLEEGVDEGDVALPHLAIDFGTRPGANAPRQLVILQRQDLAVGRGKVEVIRPGPLAAKERRRDRIRRETQEEIDEWMIGMVGNGSEDDE